MFLAFLCPEVVYNVYSRAFPPFIYVKSDDNLLEFQYFRVDVLKLDFSLGAPKI